MKANCIYLLFFFISTVPLQGQYLLQGQIASDDGKVLINATFICRSEENIIHSYTISDEKGNFEITIFSRGNYILEVSSLGFKSVLIPIEINDTTIEITLLDVVLEKSYIKLDEVILAKDRPILVKKDTVVFSAEYFERGNEQNVEDLLKNIPSVNVRSDGTITVGDREVEKVMIEGDDFFKKGYKMITRNMPADPVDKIEIINNYSQNPLLKGIYESEKIALNLQLEEDSKRIWFGNLDLGYGISSESRYDISSILMNFGKRNKYYFFGDLNNVGEDSKSDIDKLIAPLDLESKTYIGDGVHSNSLVRLDAAPINFKKQRANFNNSELLSLNAIFNPGNSFQITANGFLNWDENQFFRNSSSTVDVIGSNFTNNEVYRLNKTNSTRFSALDFEYNINETELLEGSLSYSNKEYTDISDLLFNSVSTIEDLNSSGTRFNSRLNYSNRIKKDKVFLLTTRYIYEDIPQEYSINQFYYAELFPQFSNANNVSQRSNNQMQFAGIEGHILNKTKAGNLWQVQLGNAYRKDELLSIFSLKEDALTLGQPVDFQNNLEFRTNDLYLKTSYRNEMDKLVVSGELGFHQIFNTYATAANEIIQSPFYINPRIGLEWSPNDSNTFRTGYSYNTTNATAVQAYDNYLITGYRTFFRGTGSFDQINASRLLFTYQLGNWSDKFFTVANILYIKNHDFFSRNSIVNQNFNLSEQIRIDDRELLSISSNLDYFLQPISSNIKIDLGLSTINYKNIVNNSDLREINSLNFNYGAQMRSGFSGKLNFHLGTKWITNKITTSFTSSFTDNTSFADISLIFNDQINLELQTERYFFGNLDKESSTYYFMDFSMRYTVNKKLNISISGNNLFNTENFRRYSISDLGNSITSYRLLPRFLLIKLKYRFGLK
ncbi:MAG: carboxypeptidase-like regulatory domain-containing protein [Eudoraea sp.]|nr:carboxypeptidase-like regulatory domain-containing protein [Eudoraea sp.]